MAAQGTDLRRFFWHSGVYAFGNAVDRLGAFILLPVYTHFLTVSEYGTLELFYAIGAVVSGFLSVGLAHATLRFYFEYPDPSDRNAVVSTNLLASIAITTLGVLPVAYFAGELSEFLLDDPAYKTGVWLLLATIVLELSSQVGLSYVRAVERSVLFVSVSVAKLVAQVAVNSVTVMVLNAGVVGVLAGNLATVALAWILLSGFALRHCGWRFSLDKLLPVLKYSYPFLLATLVGLVSANIDRFLIKGLVDLRALGLYALATKLSKLLYDLIGEPFNQAYGSFRFSIMGKADAGAIQARIVRYLLAASCFAALGLVYVVDAVLHVLSAPEYWPAAKLVPILALAAVLRLVTYPLQTGILYGKHTRHLFHISVMVAVLSAVGGLILINWLEELGACITVLLTSFAAMVMTNRVSQRYFPVSYPYARFGRVLLVTIVFYGLSLPLSAFGVWVSSALKLPLLVAYGWAVVAVGGIEGGEIALARALVADRWAAARRGRGLPGPD